MEQAREEMDANSVARAAELKRKGLDAPLMKSEGHYMLGSPMKYVSSGGDWPKTLPHVYTNMLGGSGLNRSITSFDGSEPVCTSPSSMKDPGLTVEELTVRNYKTTNLSSVSSSNSREGMRPRQSQWHHLYQLASGSRNKMTPNVREDLTGMTSEIWDLKPLLSKQTKEISAQFTGSDNKIMSSNKLPFGHAQSKILSASSSHEAFVKKTLNSKGIVCKGAEAHTGFDISFMGQNTEKQAPVALLNSSASMGVVFRNMEACSESGVSAMNQNNEKPACVALLNSNTNHDQHSSHSADKANHESFDEGISLRDRLKPGGSTLNKVESMHLFKQIVELVDFAHSRGVALRDLHPACFTLLPSNRIKYTGSSAQRELDTVVCQNMNKKRSLQQAMVPSSRLGAKQPKLRDDVNSLKNQSQLTLNHGLRSGSVSHTDIHITGQDSDCAEHMVGNVSGYQSTSIATQQRLISLNVHLQDKWYASPEELIDGICTCSSNIYSLGVLLFELLCSFESSEMLFAAMMELRQRILPPNFLSENPKEAGFCLWLLHPEPSSRPTTREILHSDLICGGSQELYSRDEFPLSADDDDTESELLLYFLTSLKEQKEKHASKLVQDIACLEADLKEVETRNLFRTSSTVSCTHTDFPHGRGKQGLCPEDPLNSSVHYKSIPGSNVNEAILMKNIRQLESAYFSLRSKIGLSETNVAERPDKDLLKNHDKLTQVQNENEELSMNQKPKDRIGAFFEGLCKFARYGKFEVRGTLRNGDLLNSANVTCSLSFDRDQDYIAAAGVSKKIKIFEFDALLNDSVDIHYPVVEMSNKSKLSCVCWNNYIKNYLASTDYDGVVQMWDASTGEGFSQYTEHQKRAWSVDFSPVDPTKFASGSDDCSVKLWHINERNSTSTIWNPANVCCVQFSAYSTHLLVFGSADYKIYGYDLRHTRIPWCVLAGHQKAVSYVKFLDSETLVSASTDNTLKLWDLNKTNLDGLSSNACTLTFTGHTNEKNFVGLSVLDGYIACGSETNEVYTYHRSLPMPVTSHKFGSIDPITEHEIVDDNGQFVSSVCWRQNSNMVVAANSSGRIKLLQLV